MIIKSSILEILKENKDKTISGEALSKKLNVSRSAIWKAINSLRKDGYIIKASTNKGYNLLNNPDILSKENILPFLKDEYKDSNLLVYKTLDSTNLEAKRNLTKDFLDKTIIIANEQTNGKGRLGRNFYSPLDTGIYMSIIFKPKMHISDAVLITTSASVAICKAIKSVTNLEPKIKWVNDIFLNNKKICGILTEAITDFESGMVESIILGIGINFKTTKFPEELKDIATSLFTENQSNINRCNLIGEVINEVFNTYENLNDNSFLEEYKKLSLVIGKDIRFFKDNTWINAKAIDIDSKGGLIIKYNDITQTLNSGEITIRSV